MRTRMRNIRPQGGGYPPSTTGGRLGEWNFLVCRNPQSLGRGLSTLVDERRGRIRITASLVHTQVERDVVRQPKR